YQVVSCAVGGNVSYRFKEGSSKWWTAIQVRDHRVPVAKLEYRSASGEHVTMTRESYNYFVAHDGVGDQPDGLAVRLTASDGQVLEDVLNKVREGVVVAGSGQFR